MDERYILIIFNGFFYIDINNYNLVGVSEYSSISFLKCFLFGNHQNNIFFIF
jgi:hypothetical protein